MTSNMKAGQIWQVKGSSDLAVVVFVWDDEFLGEDVRALPAFSGPTHVAMATERDIVVAADHSSLDADLLVNCWNGQVVSRGDLAVCVGTISDSALDAARAVEMAGLEPDAAAAFSHWVGAVLASDNDLRLTARREYFARWQDIRAALTLFQGAVRMTFSAPHSAGRLFKGLDGFTGEFSAFTMLVQSLDSPTGTTAGPASSAADDDTTLRAA
jgi:hypothetical protein